jgi:hypothetical protein
MPDEPSRPLPRHYWRPDPDATEEELEAGAEAFLDAIFGPVRDVEGGPSAAHDWVRGPDAYLVLRPRDLLDPGAREGDDYDPDISDWADVTSEYRREMEAGPNS